MLKKYILIISFLLIPISAFADSYEGIGTTTSRSVLTGSEYMCMDSNALNYLGTSTERDSCIYTPPTMQELLVINSSIMAFASMIWMIRLIGDFKNKHIL